MIRTWNRSNKHRVMDRRLVVPPLVAVGWGIVLVLSIHYSASVIQSIAFGLAVVVSTMLASMNIAATFIDHAMVIRHHEALLDTLTAAMKWQLDWDNNMMKIIEGTDGAGRADAIQKLNDATRQFLKYSDILKHYETRQP
jgi:hypothetical protein